MAKPIVDVDGFNKLIQSLPVCINCRHFRPATDTCSLFKSPVTGAALEATLARSYFNACTPEGRSFEEALIIKQ